MPSTKEEIFKELDDMRRQSVQDWKERVLRVEDIWHGQKTEQEKNARAKAIEEEAVKNYIEWAHENPEHHLKDLAKELEREMFCLCNRFPYEPSMKNGLPGYWDYRDRMGDEWILKTRERLPNE